MLIFNQVFFALAMPSQCSPFNCRSLLCSVCYASLIRDRLLRSCQHVNRALLAPTGMAKGFGKYFSAIFTPYPPGSAVYYGVVYLPGRIRCRPACTMRAPCHAEMMLAIIHFECIINSSSMQLVAEKGKKSSRRQLCSRDTAPPCNRYLVAPEDPLPAAYEKWFFKIP